MLNIPVPLHVYMSTLSDYVCFFILVEYTCSFFASVIFDIGIEK